MVLGWCDSLNSNAMVIVIACTFVCADIHKEVGEVVRGLAGRMEKLKPLMGGGYVFSGKVRQLCDTLCCWLLCDGAVCLVLLLHMQSCI